MTSDTKQSEVHEESRMAVVDHTEPPSQATEPQASVAGEALGTTGSEESISQRSKRASHVPLSVGYIPISTKTQSSRQATGDTGDQGTEEPVESLAEVPDADAFESFERDLAELGSFLGAPNPGPAAVANPPGNAIEPVAAESTITAPEASNGSDASLSIQPISLSSHEESSIMNAQAQHQQEQSSSEATTRVAVETAVAAYQSSAMETDGVLHDVQSTLDSLAGMAHGLSEQKLEIMKMRELLEERRLATVERERQLSEREDRLRQQEQRLQDEKQGIERASEQSAAVLAERSSALQALAETVDSRDRATAKRAEALNQEQQSIERQLSQLRARAQELDDREVGLQRQGAELADRFKQLLDAKERFGAIVKGFNETVRFNTTYSAISKSVGSETEETSI